MGQMAISKDMNLRELLTKYPNSARVFSGMASGVLVGLFRTMRQ